MLLAPMKCSHLSQTRLFIIIASKGLASLKVMHGLFQAIHSMLLE